MSILTNDMKLSFKKSALILRAVNHKLRQIILEELVEEKKVTDLYVKLRLEQSVASQHLAILRKAGLVTTRRDGKFIYYRINIDALEYLRSNSDRIMFDIEIANKQ